MRDVFAEVEPLCTPATCCVIASAPSFPHGVVDGVRALGALAQERGFGMHVDNCLGGVLLQHLQLEGLLRTDGEAAAVARLGLQLPGLTTMHDFLVPVAFVHDCLARHLLPSIGCLASRHLLPRTERSFDLHKYGYASKGVSMVLFRTKELRRRTFHPIVRSIFL